MILEFSRQKGLVRRHVHQPVAAPVEEDDFFLAFLLGLEGLADDHRYGVIGLGRADEAFRTGEGDPGLEGLELWHGLRPDQVAHGELADDGSHPVVAEAAGVDAFRDEVVPEGVHRKERGHLDRVTEIIGEGAAGHGRAGGRLDADDVDILAVDLVTHEREADPGEIASAPGAADDDVRIITGHGHLLLALQAVDRLVHHHVVQDAAEGVFRVFIHDGGFHRLADGDPQTAGRFGVLREDAAPGLCFRARAGDALAPPGFHHDPPIRLLVKAHLDHVHLGFDAEK